MTAALTLHKGGERISEEELSYLDAPAPSGRWRPVAHRDVLAAVKASLDAAGYTVVAEQLATARQGALFFGALDLGTELVPGVSLAVGVRNSTDKSLPMGFCAGNRVFVCDNLAFTSELMVKHRHTTHGRERFVEAIKEAVARLASFREMEAVAIGTLRARAIHNDTGEAVILRAWERGVIGRALFRSALLEWRQPTHEPFLRDTAWSLLNAFTTAIREEMPTRLARFAAVTMALRRFVEEETSSCSST